MTATPHSGKEEDFQLFLTLLDRDRFEGKYRAKVHNADTSGVMRRMVKEDLLTFEGKPLFPERVAETVPYELTELEQDLYEQVTNYVREGNDVTIVTLARMVHVASEAANLLAKEGIECEILDLRTTSPLDEDSILESVEKTGRLVVVDEASPRCNMATDVSALVAQKSFRSLKAPIRMVTPPHTPVPFSDVLEDEYLPNPGKVAAAVQDVMRYKA